MFRTRFNPHLRHLTATFLLFIVFTLSQITAGHAAWECQCTPDLCAKYQAAVIDTGKEATADKISKNLTPITVDNPDLIWENDVVGSRVLVASYASDDGGKTKPCKDCQYYRTKWITVVPELYNFFRNKPFSTRRLEQLLGLPPCYGNSKIIEFFVIPADLIRPSPDPEINDQEATLDFPWENNWALQIKNYGPDDPNNFFDDFNPQCSCPFNPADPCHRQTANYEEWFNNRNAVIYGTNVPNCGAPYPWTRLGYTYDWGNDHSHEGLSEFLLLGGLNRGATVTIQSVMDEKEYFSPAPAQRPSLTVTKIGGGNGTVKSFPAGISCGHACSKAFNKYTGVTLTAKPSTGSTFVGWSGNCRGSGATCTVTMYESKNVEAIFE